MIIWITFKEQTICFTCKPGQVSTKNRLPANQDTFSFWSGIPITALCASSISILQPFGQKLLTSNIFRFKQKNKTKQRCPPASRTGHSGGLPPPGTHCISLSWVYLRKCLGENLSEKCLGENLSEKCLGENLSEKCLGENLSEKIWVKIYLRNV